MKKKNASEREAERHTAHEAAGPVAPAPAPVAEDLSATSSDASRLARPALDRPEAPADYPVEVFAVSDERVEALEEAACALRLLVLWRERGEGIDDSIWAAAIAASKRERETVE